MTKLITQVHLKLTVQLESRMRDMEAATDCTLFLPKDSDIVKEMLAIGRHCSNMIRKSSRARKRKPSHMVLPLDGESNHRVPDQVLDSDPPLLPFLRLYGLLQRHEGWLSCAERKPHQEEHRVGTWQGAQQRDHARQRQVKGRKGRKGDAPTDSAPVVQMEV